MKTFEEQTKEYAETLAKFVAEYNLPKEWFAVADHLAVKGADGTEFEALVEHTKAAAYQVSCIDLDGRRLATAKLKETIKVGDFGTVEWLEIMEPRPEKIGKDVVGLEHMEFYFPDFTTAEAVLKEKGIAYEIQQNPGHTWINIVLNDRGQELKLNNKTLSDIVTEELKTGESYLL
jgi:predicted metalloenzyme YecM